jgi:hypothetical protein
MAARMVSAASLACLVFQALAVEISDCGVGTYFLENPQDEQTCQKVEEKFTKFSGKPRDAREIS